MADRVERKTVIFRAKMSTADNCVCNACHNVGKVTKLTVPETKYFDGRKLTTHYFDFWLCMDCREAFLLDENVQIHYICGQ